MMAQRKPPPDDLGRPITLPDAERGRAPAEVERWEKARADLSNARLVLNDKQKEARLRVIAQIEAAPEQEADKAWRAAANDETAYLATLRGEDVERLRSGGVRVNSRDPLTSLWRAGHLTAEQHEVGKAVCDLYAARLATGGASQLAALTGPGGGHDNDRFVFTRHEAAKRSQRLRVIELALVAEPAAHAMLKAVCGWGLSLSSQGEGRAFERNLRALVLALDVAEAILRRRA